MSGTLKGMYLKDAKNELLIVIVCVFIICCGLYVKGLTINGLFDEKTEFCQGFKKGYKAGFRIEAGKTFDPIITLSCPEQPKERRIDYVSKKPIESDYFNGYSLGLEKGMERG